MGEGGGIGGDGAAPEQPSAAPRPAQWSPEPHAAGGPPRRASRSAPPAAVPPGLPLLAKLALGAVALLLLGCTLLIVVGSVPNTTALILSTLAATIPAVVYASIVVRLDWYEQEPPRALAAAFGWGAVGAVVLSVLGGIAFQAAVVGALDSPELGDIASIVIGAPLIEETFKGIALLAIAFAYRRELDNTLDGLIYGALIGLGFAFTENILYFGGAYLEGGVVGLGTLFIGRAVIGGWGHAIYTGFTGAAIGWARGRYRRGVLRFVVPFLGWCVAVLLHAAWNFGAVALSATAAADDSLVAVLLPLALAVIVPGVVLLYIVARLSRRRQLAILRDQLQPEIAVGAITAEEFAAIADDGRRRAALQAADAAGGRELRRRQQRFFSTAADLAFRKHHLANGDLLTPGQRAPESVLREELAALRQGLPIPPPAAPVVP